MNKIISIDLLSSGMMKSRKAINLVEQVAWGEVAVEVPSGRIFKAKFPVKGSHLEAGMIVFGYYNYYNQGADIYLIRGFSSNNPSYGKGGPKFDSVKEVFKYYKVKSLAQLENFQDERYDYGHQTYMCVENLSMTKGDKTKYVSKGCWFYLFKRRWSRGSGAEPLSFVLMEEIYSNPYRRRKV